MDLITLNGIRFEAPRQWTFHPFENLILARPDTRTGVLQISSAFKSELAESSGHEACTVVARRFVGAQGDIFDLVRWGEGSDLFGAFSIHVGNHFTRVWYRFRGGQLLLATYGCSWDGRNTPEVQRILADADRLVRMARYDEAV